MTEELPFCECGECGLRVTKPGNRFIHGHNRRGDKNSPEHNAATSKALTGVPNPHTSPAQIAGDKAKSEKMSGVLHTSKAQIAADEARRGVPRLPEICAKISESQTGIDLIWHHIAYDFGDPDALKVLITRKFHGQIHHPKGIGIHQRGYSLID